MEVEKTSRSKKQFEKLKDLYRQQQSRAYARLFECSLFCRTLILNPVLFLDYGYLGPMTVPSTGIAEFLPRVAAPEFRAPVRVIPVSRCEEPFDATASCVRYPIS
jgi:hypothetical protein